MNYNEFTKSAGPPRHNGQTGIFAHHWNGPTDRELEDESGWTRVTYSKKRHGETVISVFESEIYDSKTNNNLVLMDSSREEPPRNIRNGRNNSHKKRVLKIRRSISESDNSDEDIHTRKNFTISNDRFWGSHRDPRVRNDTRWIYPDETDFSNHYLYKLINNSRNNRNFRNYYVPEYMDKIPYLYINYRKPFLYWYQNPRNNQTYRQDSKQHRSNYSKIRYVRFTEDQDFKYFQTNNSSNSFLPTQNRANYRKKSQRKRNKTRQRQTYDSSYQYQKQFVYYEKAFPPLMSISYAYEHLNIQIPTSRGNSHQRRKRDPIRWYKIDFETNFMKSNRRTTQTEQWIKENHETPLNRKQIPRYRKQRENGVSVHQSEEFQSLGNQTMTDEILINIPDIMQQRELNIEMIASKKSNDILQKRIPKNPKYDNVESTLDTGSSLNRYLKRIEDIRQNYRIRKDELFKRMKVSTFVQLVLQVAEINNHLYCDKMNENHTIEEGNEANEDALTAPRDDCSTARTTATVDTVVTHRSTFQGVISGVGELDVNNTNNHAAEPVPIPNDTDHEIVFDNMPYLLLDVRDRDEFDQCHIIKSLSYPSAMISRSVNFETKEMLACRNKPGKIIIIYDEDERIAPRVADTLVQRGYDNLFMLSGGLKVAYKRFPQGLITGKIPESVRLATNTNNTKTKQKSTKNTDLPVTSQSQRPVPPQPNESIIHKSEFSMEDLAYLSTNLDAALDSKSSVGSSVYSHQSKTNASRHSLTSSLTAASGQVDHKKPFKC